MTFATNLLQLSPASLGVGLGMGVALAWVRSADSAFKLRSLIASALRLKIEGRTGFHAVSTDQLDWTANGGHSDIVRYYMKPLHHDAVRGGRVMQVRYPAGEINPLHTHPVAHGMYVLQGTLVTHRGEFGPNSFVWFPADEPMIHGATPDADVVVLFIAGPELETEYLPQTKARRAT